MAGFKQFLNGLFAGDNVRDYEHASRLFRDDIYRLAPKSAYLFYVVININPAVRSELSFDSRQSLEVGALCKSVTLPRFSIQTQDNNQYGRHTVTQHRINYDDVTMTLHDDRNNTVLEFWDNYYKYFYQDSVKDRQTGYNNLVGRDTYSDYRPNADFGYQPGQRVPFIQDIRIYSMYQKKFTEYVLLRPMIKTFAHGEHNVSSTNVTMEHQMTISYEAVMYGEGYVNLDGNPPGIGLHYDRKPSAIANNTTSILGPGGAVDSITNVVGDLSRGNILGAVLGAGKAIDNFENVDLGDVIKEEGITLAKDVFLRGKPLRNVFSFPKAGSPGPADRRPAKVQQQNNPPPSNQVTSNGEDLGSTLPWRNESDPDNRYRTNRSTGDRVGNDPTLNTRRDNGTYDV